MTEAFDALSVAQFQQQQQQPFLPHDPIANPQAHLHPNTVLAHQQATYYYNDPVAELASGPTHNLPMSPPLTPHVQSNFCHDPAVNHITSKDLVACSPPPQTLAMPVELPDNVPLAAQAPIPTAPVQTEVSLS